MSNEYKDWMMDSLNDCYIAIDMLIDKVLELSPQHEEWIKQNFKDYLERYDDE